MRHQKQQGSQQEQGASNSRDGTPSTVGNQGTCTMGHQKQQGSQQHQGTSKQGCQAQSGTRNTMGHQKQQGISNRRDAHIHHQRTSNSADAKPATAGTPNQQQQGRQTSNSRDAKPATVGTPTRGTRQQQRRQKQQVETARTVILEIGLCPGNLATLV
jgi:hypothetical protein